jgi:hypothetical protein
MISFSGTARETKGLSGRCALAKLNCTIDINELTAVASAEDVKLPYIEGYYTGFLVMFVA